MRDAVAVVVCAPHGPADAAVARLALGPEPYVLVHSPDVVVDDASLAALVDAMSAPMAATTSPVPAGSAEHGRVVPVALDVRLPPAPTLSGACVDICLISRSALASIGPLTPHQDWASMLAAEGARLVAGGWRHVAAPGTSLRWTPALTPVNGPANVGLATHRLWADTRARGARVVVDGACLTDDPHNGSQAVVWNVALALQRARPHATVSLAVPDAHVDLLGRLAAGSGIGVVRRDDTSHGFDVVYRPYQPLDPGELSWLTAAGERLVTSQLDMIGFSNPEYHPSPALFHAVRNLQRHTMRLADGITFISEFGRQAAFAECPDLDPARTSVVWCGADAAPIAEPVPSADLPSRLPGRFLVCTSATFWHKNRQHAIRVFDSLVRDHGYAGSLVIAGPEPYYGRSTAEDDALVDALEPRVRERVLRVGQVDSATKWWLLERADVVLYPSIVEGFGLVPFEAAAVATPCLTSAGSATGELLGSTRAAVHTWDVAEWAADAARLIASSDEAAALVAEVRGVASTLTWDATAERTWAAIDAALARPPARRHAEEGGIASRVAGAPAPLAPGAKLAHFGNRLRSYATRRVHG